MNKVKLFRFNVNNHEEYGKVVTEEEIENTINTFLTGKELVSLKISTIEVKHRGHVENDIDLIYTIVYK